MAAAPHETEDAPRRGEVILFLLLAYGLSWSYWFWLYAHGVIVAPGSGYTHLPGLAGPGIAALLVTLAFRGPGGAKRLLAAMIVLPRKPAVALAALAVPVVVAAVVLAAQVWAGGAAPPMRAFLSYPGTEPDWSAAAILAIAIFANGYGEETGWRGFLLPRLLARHGPITATLIVAGLWMAWHGPVFLVAASMHALLGPALVGWMIGLTLGAFVLSWLWIVSGGSVLTVAAWHVLYNFSVSTQATSGLVAAVVSSVVMVWGLVIALRWARRG